METTSPVAPITTRESQPPEAILSEFKESLPVEFNKLRIAIVCFLLELSFCITTSLESGQTRTIWGLSCALIAWVVFTLVHKSDLEKNSLCGLLILDAWFLYGLLPWGQVTYMIPQYIIAGASPVLTALFFLSVDSRISGYVFFTQMVCLLYPVKISSRIEPGELWMGVLFFGVAWNTYLTVITIMTGKVNIENALMATLPLLRLQGTGVLFYIVILECFLAFQFYAVWVPVESTSTPQSSRPEAEEAEQTKLQHTQQFDHPHDSPLEFEEEEQQQKPLVKDMISLLQRVQPKTKSRFKVVNLIQTPSPSAYFNKIVPVAHLKVPLVSPQQHSVNIFNPGNGPEIERLGGSHLKDVYGKQ